MKKLKMAALLVTAVVALTPVFGCRANKKVKSNNNEVSAYADLPDVGKNKVEVNLEEKAEVKTTSFKLNRVIDSGRVKDGLKYIYLDVTIKNNSDKDYEISGLNNFYLLLPDKTEVLTDVRADIYAKQALSGYEQLNGIAAGSEVTSYIGFAVNENVKDFTACFFPPTAENEKTDVIRCDVKAGDIIAAPDGLFSEAAK